MLPPPAVGAPPPGGRSVRPPADPFGPPPGAPSPAGVNVAKGDGKFAPVDVEIGLPVQVVLYTTASFQAVYEEMNKLKEAARKSGLFIVSDSDLAFNQPVVRVKIWTGEGEIVADLVMLDTRVIDRDVQALRDQAAVIDDPNRSLLGRAQEEWLFRELSQPHALRPRSGHGEATGDT